MSIAEIAAESSRIVRTDARVVTLDIERLPGSFTADFWDLNAFKNRRIHADLVTAWPRTICAAWKWYHGKRVEFAAEWLDGGHENMTRQLWTVFDEADVIYGHNIDGFDVKKLKTDWRDLGLPPPSPFKTVDTLKIARREFGDESRTLDALCKRLNIPAKTDKYSVEVARAACAGDKTAQRKIAAYNRGDILASEALVDRLRAWLPSHPHLGALDQDEARCNACGSTDLERNGTVLAVQIRYVAYRCRNCGGNLRSAQHSRAANVRGAR